MATLTWITGTSGLWTTAANWSSDAVPGAGDTAVVNVPGSYLVSVPGTVSVGNAILDDTAAEISVGGSLSIAGSMTVTAGALEVSGGLDAASLSNAGTVGNSGILDIGALSNAGFIGNGDFLSVATLSNTGSIDNTGTLELTGTVLTLTGTINDSGAVIVSGSVTGASLAQIGGAGVLSIFGTVDNAGAVLGGNGLHVQSAGLIQGGTIVGIVLNDGATIDGVTASGVVQVNGSLTILDGLSGSAGGTGTLSFVTGATLAFANAETLDNLGLTGAGVINTDSTLTVGSHVVITAHQFNTASALGFEGVGTVINIGTAVAVSTASINAHGNAAVIIGNADFENSGVLSATDASANVGPSSPEDEGRAELDITGATFVNEAGGLIETGQSFGVGLVAIGAATDFTNDGTLSTWNPATSTGGTIDIAAFVQGNGTIEINGGGAASLGAVTGAQIIDFLGAGTLTLNQPTFVPAVIEGFATADAIVLSGVSATAISYTSGDLKLQTASGTLDLAVTGSHTLSDFQISTVGGNTDITVCFCAGTCIRTPRGEIEVEKLAVGDTVTTWQGQTRPIVWIGTGKVLATRGRRNAATPVIVRKGALGDNMPHSDLHVTKAHSLLIDDVLIPVEFLVNHRSILWDDRAQEVTIYHIELETHDVLIANGTPAESYRDDGNRWLFQNANSGWGLPPQEPCAPVLTGGKLVDAIWRRLLDRAGPRRTLPLTDDADLYLLADGKRLDPVTRDGDVYVFRLYYVPTSLSLVSRAAIPAELGLARDPRSLGVAVRRITVRKGTRFRTLGAHDTRLSGGFHAFEPGTGLRWTDGDAAVPVELFAGFTGELEFVLQLATTGHYLDEGDVRRTA
jgi:hypothetical protein